MHARVGVRSSEAFALRNLLFPTHLTDLTYPTYLTYPAYLTCLTCQTRLT